MAPRANDFRYIIIRNAKARAIGVALFEYCAILLDRQIDELKRFKRPPGQDILDSYNILLLCDRDLSLRGTGKHTKTVGPVSEEQRRRQLERVRSMWQGKATKAAARAAAMESAT